MKKEGKERPSLSSTPLRLTERHFPSRIQPNGKQAIRRRKYNFYGPRLFHILAHILILRQQSDRLRNQLENERLCNIEYVIDNIIEKIENEEQVN
ncbi:unnamed protein product [Rotaria sordida]|uniref:Uncharacterized protein n=1 Tax=Rotaria sordida TaxID=392033 RepID=A0A819DRB2_9BILA|nr:unnamed protein product [Rotaria sordida]CAF3834961.1 unnamed protein product [Rotaria sordida]CAF3922899.1 unnamed protein product [Rotaria sordida]